MSPSPSPAQLAALLKEVSPDLRDQVLRRLLRAKWATEWTLRRQLALRLWCIERGWEDYWLLVHTHTTETLAEIEQVLATC